jgi:hypothetical protein
MISLYVFGKKKSLVLYIRLFLAKIDPGAQKLLSRACSFTSFHLLQLLFVPPPSVPELAHTSSPARCHR